MAKETKGKVKAKTREPQKRGRKPMVKKFQKADLDTAWVPAYIVLALSAHKGAVKQKTDLIDNCAKHFRAKYGSRNTWRDLEVDAVEPPPGADTDADDTPAPAPEAGDDSGASSEVIDIEPKSVSAVAHGEKDDAEAAGQRLNAIRHVRCSAERSRRGFC